MCVRFLQKGTIPLQSTGSCCRGHLLLPSATKLRRLCFYTCLSFCPQGWVCLSACLDTTPPPPEQTPPPRSRDGYCYGQYASYWNAFLFSLLFTTRKQSLRQRNIFTPVCQSFCSQGGGSIWAGTPPGPKYTPSV